MGCKVKKILAPNGKPSKVFDKISSVYGAEVGLVAYLHMHSPAFLEKNAGVQTDENGEYDWRAVLESMNLGENAVNKVVERSVGVRKSSGRLVTYEADNAHEKARAINERFIQDRNPFIAKVETLPNGKTNIYVEVVDKTNLDPNKDDNVENDFDDDMDYLDFSEDATYEEDFSASEDWLGDYMGWDEDVDLDNLDELDISDDIFIDMDEDMSFSDAMDNAIDELVDTKRNRPTKADHKYKNVLKTLALQKKNLEQRLGRVEDNIQLALKNKDKEKVTKLRKKASNYRVQINDIDKLIEKAMDFSSLRQMTSLVERDLEHTEKKLKSLKGLDILELQGLKRTMDFWSKAGEFTEGGNHILFSKTDLRSKPMKKLYRGYKGLADNMLVEINAELKERFEQYLKEKLGANANIDEVYQLAKDINFAHANIFDISRVDNMIFQAIFKGVNHAKQRAKMETDKIVSKIDEMMPKVLEEARKVNKSSNPFDIFIQTTKDGKRTGNIVTMIDESYATEKDKHFRSVVRNKNATYKDKEKAYQWLRDNEIFFDWRKIFFDHNRNLANNKGKPFTQEDRDAHIAELEEQFGKEHVATVVADMEARLYEFEIDFETKVNDTFDANEDMAQINATALKVWEMQHSPFYASRNAATGQPNRYGGRVVPSNGKKLVTFMPRKTINGKPTTYYDKKYEQIQVNPVLKEFHDYYMETMKTLNLMLPHSKRHQLKSNSIVFAQKTVKEMAWSKEMGVDKSSVEVLANIGKEMVRTTNYGTTSSNAFDPATGEQIREVSANFVNDGKKELKQMVNSKALVWQASNKGKEASDEMKRQWRIEAMDDLANRKSYDLGHVLKNYALLANAYKHKAAVEDKVHLAHEMFKQIEEGIKNAKGDNIKDEYGEDQSKKGLEQMTKMLDHFMDNFDNFKQRDDHVINVDVTTKKEKEEIARIDKAIESLKELLNDKKINKAKYEELMSELILQKESIGGKLSVDKVGDQVLWLAQIKGLGYNLPAAFVNFIFGQLSNIIEGASGRFFKQDSISNATKAVLFNKKHRKKAILMAEKLDILSDGYDIQTGTSKKKFFGRASKYVGPHGATTIAEEFNQAPIVIAAMKEEMLTIDGKQISWWDATDENGNLLPQYATPENVAQYEGDNNNPLENQKLHEFTTRTKQIIKKIHGNYDPNSPVLIKKKLWGRAMIQFKSWLGESIAARFEAEKVDYITGTTRKGRYRTLWEAKNEEGDPIVGFKPAMNRFTAILKGAIPFMGVGSTKDLNISQTDIQNMREVAKELQITLMLLLLGSLAVAAREGADDDSPEKWAATLLANNIARVSKDLTSFMSPAWPMEFLNKPMAALSVKDDLNDVFAGFTKLAMSDYTIKSGINAGENRVIKEAMEFFPVTNQYRKIKNMGDKLYANPYSLHGIMQSSMKTWIDEGK